MERPGRGDGGPAVISAPLLRMDACRIFFDGTFSTPRLDHPECVTVAADGAVWCGGEAGQIYRIDPTGSAWRRSPAPAGSRLGLAFGPDGALYVCDAVRRAVLRFDPADGGLTEFAAGPPGRAFTMPNYPVFDAEGRLYVSDSGPRRPAGPRGVPVRPLRPRRGLARRSVHRRERARARARRRRVVRGGDVRQPRHPHRHRAGRRRRGARGLRRARRDARRARVRARRRPLRRVLRAERDLRVDARRAARAAGPRRAAHTLCRPTNLAFRGATLFAANLGRWHVTALDLPGGTDAP